MAWGRCMARFCVLICALLMATPVLATTKMPAVPAGAVASEHLAVTPPKPVYAVPEHVTVGAHINDILEVNLQNHSYRLDMYVWFRWKNPAFKPWETAEFMNAFDPADHVRTPLYDAPEEMPDGSLYMVIRQQGIFSAKFPLQAYPFDRQLLTASMEDSVYDTTELVYVPDAFESAPISINQRINLPGFDLSPPLLDIRSFSYPTLFGDLREKEASDYTRADFVVPVSRPWIATGVKIFLPVSLILLCTAMVFYVHPFYIEGRLGVVITALLTLVALQLTTASGLPEVDYLLLTDKIYILCYLFIIATLMQVVRSSGKVQAGKFQTVQKNDQRMLVLLLVVLVCGVMFIGYAHF